jgi:N-acetylneuraminic acid mutarotase
MAAPVGNTEPWSTSINALPLARGNHTSVTYNGYVYVMGGYGGGINNTVYYAQLNSDGSVGMWNTSANVLPQPVAMATSVVYNGYVYVMGGRDGSNNYINTVYYAQLNSDGTVGTWNTSANALPQVDAAATSVTYNGYVYVMSGNAAGTDLDTVYYAQLNSNGSVGTWNTSANVLPQAMHYAASVTYNGYVYFMGGYNNSGTQNTVYYAQLNSNGSVGTWNTSANVLPSATDNATAVVNNGYVYIMGGENSSGALNNAVYYTKLNSDGTVGAWSTNTNSLPQAAKAATAVAYNGYMYVIGGYYSSGLFSTTYLDTIYYTHITPTPPTAPASPNNATVSTASNTAKTSPTAPDTGFGMPGYDAPLAKGPMIGAIISIGAGLALLYKRSKAKNSLDL